jgi:hypothetical protein
MLKTKIKETTFYKFKLSKLSYVDNTKIKSIINECLDNQFFLKKLFNRSKKVLVSLPSHDVNWVAAYIDSAMRIYQKVHMRPHTRDLEARITKDKTFKKSNSTLNFKDISLCSQMSFLYVVDGQGHIYLEWGDIINRKGYHIFPVEEKDIIGFTGDIKYSIKSDQEITTLLYSNHIV